IEQAWLDLQARAAGVTLARQLGGCYRQAVPVYANINRGIPAARSPQAFASQARLAVADGYRAIKIAPFDGVHWQSDAAAHRPSLRDIGIERVLAVRDAIGSDVRLLIDCHGRFDAVGASVVIDALAAAQPFWLEDILDPVFRGDDGRSIRQQAHRHGIRVAGGEELAELGDFLALLETASTDVVLPDLRLTGIRAGMIICEVAAARGQQVSLHNPVGPVLDAVSRHVAAALPNFLILERPVRESPIWEALGVSNAGLIDGDATLEAEAGLGVDLGSDYLRSAGEAGFLPGRVSYRGLPGAGPDA
ncbi:MAG TPA: enolase C-terminal domain-like protein, partial [Devosia sp.]|nr:enolase C-terminal domain-like protein [Devosia sp.]